MSSSPAPETHGRDTRGPVSWRRRLRREVSWLLLVKLCALIVLWALFFSPAHRVVPNEMMVAAQLAVAPSSTAPDAHAGGIRRD